MKKTQRYYNQKYQEEGFHWGQDPSSLVVEIADKIQGKVLEIGSGEGRNVVYLAKKGLDVTAVDFSEEGIEKSKRFAQEQGITIEHILGDITDPNLYSRLDNYDCILSINSLQLLNPEEVAFVLDAMKKHTLPQGLNAIQSFIAKDRAEKRRYRFQKGELKKAYNGWDIIKYKEFLGPWETHGEPRHRHNIVDLIAKKQE